MAGEVKARGERRRVRSDWMAVERERGISVSSAVMSFEHEGLAFNLLDTRGHQGFSPVGFQRGHLPHPDRGPPSLPSPACGGVLGRGPLDAAPNGAKGGDRGADPQALRGLPLAGRADHHFCQQSRREGRDPFDLLDEIEQGLALDVTPASWPIGMGRDFLGTYEFVCRCPLIVRARRPRPGHRAPPLQCLDDPKLPRLLPKEALAKLREEVGMAKGLCPPFDQEAYREGHLTPVYFGSALNNFGVRELLGGVAELARRRAAACRDLRLCRNSCCNSELIRACCERSENAAPGSLGGYAFVVLPWRAGAGEDHVDIRMCHSAYSRNESI